MKESKFRKKLKIILVTINYMFCENCGNKIQDGCKFCTTCGNPINFAEIKIAKQSEQSLNDMWWHRLLKILYIFFHLPLLIIIPLVWDENSYSNYGSSSSGEALWYSVLTLVIYLAILRLIKLSVVYVVFGRKPKWKREFKKFF